MKIKEDMIWILENYHQRLSEYFHSLIEYNNNSDDGKPKLILQDLSYLFLTYWGKQTIAHENIQPQAIHAQCWHVWNGTGIV